MGRGEDVPLRPGPGPVVEFWRLREMDCGCADPGTPAPAPGMGFEGPRVRSAVVDGMEDRDARAEALREDVAEDERW